MGHLEDCYWKKKYTNLSNFTTNYLEVLVNDEEATLMELNKICGANHHLSSKNKIPKKRLPMETNEAKGIVEQAQGVEARDKTREAVPNFGARSKNLLHFMKG